VTSVFNDNFEVALKVFHPILHQMHILEHSPLASLASVMEHLNGTFFLTLSHGNVNESSIVARLASSAANLFDFGSGIHTGEEHEEDRGDSVGLGVQLEDIERILIDVFSTHTLLNIDVKSTAKAIGSHCAKQEHAMEQGAFLVGTGQVIDLSTFR
jgi:hypothetical protein